MVSVVHAASASGTSHSANCPCHFQGAAPNDPSCSLSISCRAIAGGIGFLLTDEGAIFCAAVPTLPSEMIDARRQVQPHNGVFRAMLLGFLFGAEERRRGERMGGREWR